MVSSFLKIIFLIVAGALCVSGDSPVPNPDEKLCRGVDQCAAFGGMCCEGLRGGCYVRGACDSNSTVCKIDGERCGRVRCKRTESCVRAEPCVCCPFCSVPILPTCKPKCGIRACYRNEFCFSRLNLKGCVKKINTTLPVEP